MGIFDLLLETDAKKLKASNSKDCEIKRLSDILGERFIVTCTPLTAEQIQYVGEVSKNNTEMKANIVLECCKLEGKSLKSKELLEKFGVPTPIDALHKLFLPGEIYTLYETVNQLSGYNKDAVKEVKKR